MAYLNDNDRDYEQLKAALVNNHDNVTHNVT